MAAASSSVAPEGAAPKGVKGDVEMLYAQDEILSDPSKGADLKEASLHLVIEAVKEESVPVNYSCLAFQLVAKHAAAHPVAVRVVTSTLSKFCMDNSAHRTVRIHAARSLASICRAQSGEALEELRSTLSDLLGKATDALVGRELTAGLGAAAINPASGVAPIMAEVGTADTPAVGDGGLLPAPAVDDVVALPAYLKNLPVDLLRTILEDLKALHVKFKGRNQQKFFIPLKECVKDFRCDPVVVTTLALISPIVTSIKKVFILDVRKMTRAINKALASEGGGGEEDKDADNGTTTAAGASVTQQPSAPLVQAQAETGVPTPYLVIKNISSDVTEQDVLALLGRSGAHRVTEADLKIVVPSSEDGTVVPASRATVYVQLGNPGRASDVRERLNGWKLRDGWRLAVEFTLGEPSDALYLGDLAGMSEAELRELINKRGGGVQQLEPHHHHHRPDGGLDFAFASFKHPEAARCVLRSLLKKPHLTPLGRSVRVHYKAPQRPPPAVERRVQEEEENGKARPTRSRSVDRNNDKDAGTAAHRSVASPQPANQSTSSSGEQVNLSQPAGKVRHESPPRVGSSRTGREPDSRQLRTTRRESPEAAARPRREADEPGRRSPTNDGRGLRGPREDEEWDRHRRSRSRPRDDRRRPSPNRRDDVRRGGDVEKDRQRRSRSRGREKRRREEEGGAVRRSPARRREDQRPSPMTRRQDSVRGEREEDQQLRSPHRRRDGHGRSEERGDRLRRSSSRRREGGRRRDDEEERPRQPSPDKRPEDRREDKGEQRRSPTQGGEVAGRTEEGEPRRHSPVKRRDDTEEKKESIRRSPAKRPRPSSSNNNDGDEEQKKTDEGRREVQQSPSRARQQETTSTRAKSQSPPSSPGKKSQHRRSVSPASSDGGFHSLGEDSDDDGLVLLDDDDFNEPQRKEEKKRVLSPVKRASPVKESSRQRRGGPDVDARWPDEDKPDDGRRRPRASSPVEVRGRDSSRDRRRRRSSSPVRPVPRVRSRERAEPPPSSRRGEREGERERPGLRGSVASDKEHRIGGGRNSPFDAAVAVAGGIRKEPLAPRIDKPDAAVSYADRLDVKGGRGQDKPDATVSYADRVDVKGGRGAAGGEVAGTAGGSLSWLPPKPDYASLAADSSRGKRRSPSPRVAPARIDGDSSKATTRTRRSPSPRRAPIRRRSRSPPVADTKPSRPRSPPPVPRATAPARRAEDQDEEARRNKRRRSPSPPPSAPGASSSLSGRGLAALQSDRRQQQQPQRPQVPPPPRAPTETGPAASDRSSRRVRSKSPLSPPTTCRRSPPRSSRQQEEKGGQHQRSRSLSRDGATREEQGRKPMPPPRNRSPPAPSTSKAEREQRSIEQEKEQGSGRRRSPSPRAGGGGRGSDRKDDDGQRTTTKAPGGSREQAPPAPRRERGVSPSPQQQQREPGIGSRFSPPPLVPRSTTRERSKSPAGRRLNREGPSSQGGRGDLSSAAPRSRHETKDDRPSTGAPPAGMPSSSSSRRKRSASPAALSNHRSHHDQPPEAPPAKRRAPSRSPPRQRRPPSPPKPLRRSSPPRPVDGSSRAAGRSPPNRRSEPQGMYGGGPPPRSPRRTGGEGQGGGGGWGPETTGQFGTLAPGRNSFFDDHRGGGDDGMHFGRGGPQGSVRGLHPRDYPGARRGFGDGPPPISFVGPPVEERRLGDSRGEARGFHPDEEGGAEYHHKRGPVPPPSSFPRDYSPGRRPPTDWDRSRAGPNPFSPPPLEQQPPPGTFMRPRENSLLDGRERGRGGGGREGRRG